MTTEATAVTTSASASAVAPKRQRLRGLLRYFGPAFVVSVAYIDPGNFATNISGGSLFNYNLLWVILWSNLMAIFLQTMSAKLGIVTGRSLPEHCRDLFSRRTNFVLWVVAEVAAMATDLAEFLGGALGFYLLLHIPLSWAGVLTGTITLVIVALNRYGQKLVEFVIALLIGVVSVAYVLELFLARPDWGAVAIHTLVPSLGQDTVLIAAAILGATVMPHVVYLHSSLVLARRPKIVDPGWVRQCLRLEKIDIALAMNVAFVINAAMMVVAAAVFFGNDLRVETIEDAHRSLAPLLGTLSSGAFAVALLASGLSSSAVGTMAGQVIMRGFLNLRVPTVVAQLITMAPGMVIIAAGINPIQALIMSQVVLSFALPAAIIALLVVTGRRDVMGPFANRRGTKLAGWTIATLIIGLNFVLLFLTFTGRG